MYVASASKYILFESILVYISNSFEFTGFILGYIECILRYFMLSWEYIRVS